MPARHPHTKYATRGYGIVGAALSAAGPADIFGRSAQADRFEFSEWLVIVGLAISGVAIALVAYSLVTQRRGRLGKGFLLDSRGSPLKEIVFDPKCAVSLSEAKAKLPSGGLSGDEEAEVLGYRIKPIHAEKLHLILAYRGRSPPHHADYAAFLMGGVEERFDEALRGRDTEITERESSSVTREAHLQEEEGRIASRNAISAGAVKTASARAIKGLSEILEKSVERAPLRRLTDPAEVADTAVFLASDLCRGVTGNCIFVDAGLQVMGI